MTEQHRSQLHPEDPRFDLLVDGELPEPQRREFLRQLDTEPGGWKLCALAFLEAQAWQQEAKAICRKLALPGGSAADSGVERPACSAAPPAPKTRSPLQLESRRTWYATAVGVLLAFVAGMAAQAVVFQGAVSPARHGQPPGPVVADRVASAPPKRSGRLSSDVTAPAQAGRNEASQLASAGRSQSQQQGGEQWSGKRAPRARSLDWELVGIPVAYDDHTETVPLPAQRSEHLEADWPASLPSAMPAEVVRRLLDAGHQIRFRRQVLPLEMNDGRTLLVPVDDYEIRFVGGAAYQ